MKVLIMGSHGRMGREIAKLCAAEKGVKVTVEVDHSGHTPYRRIEAVSPGAVTVVIDFSAPAATVKAAQWCSKHGKPLVSGTTGLNGGQQKMLQQAARKVPVLWAPNMSLGVAILNHTLETAIFPKGFDFQVEETHHRQKKDRPSGTAIFLQKTLSGRVGALPEPISIRGGGIFGIHKVYAMGQEETLIFEHTALSRAVFARGAVMAARSLLKRRPGLYSMRDVLDF